MTKYVSLLISTFFESNVSKENRHRFHNWITKNNSCEEKQEAMYNIWNKSFSENNVPASDRELTMMRKYIRNHEQKSYIKIIYKRWALVAAIILLPLLSAALTYFLTNKTSASSEINLVEYYVPYGERKHLILVDGTEVWLNSGSFITFEKTFSGNTRTLFLSGEANFNVAHDSEKPFIVKTESMDIRAIGTEFNVQSYPDVTKSITTLESGKIEIQLKNDNLQPRIILLPNEQLIYNRLTHEYISLKVDASKNTKWIEGFMIFQSNSFDEMAKVIERKFGIKVDYKTEKFRNRSFTVRFSPDESLEDIFDILRNIVNFQYRITDNTVYIN